MSPGIVPVYEVALALKHLARFVACTSVEPHPNTGSYESSQLRCTDPSEFHGLLSELTEELAGYDWIQDDDNFLEDCIDADIDYAKLLTIPGPLTQTQLDDRERKEIGDLGELITLLFVLAYMDCDPAFVFPKNALKLYERVSEGGIDVLAFSLDLSLDGYSDPLADGEKAQAFESKASDKKSFVTLAAEAAKSINDIDLHQWQRELKLVRASLEARGASSLARRIKRFLPVFGKGPFTTSGAALMAHRTTPSTLDSANLESAHGRLPLLAVLASIDVRSLSQEAFAFRG